MSNINCPFYGFSMHFIGPRRTILIATGGNQCALISGAFAPCHREIKGLSIDWEECISVKRWRGEDDEEAPTEESQNERARKSQVAYADWLLKERKRGPTT